MSVCVGGGVDLSTRSHSTHTHTHKYYVVLLQTGCLRFAVNEPPSFPWSLFPCFFLPVGLTPDSCHIGTKKLPWLEYCDYLSLHPLPCSFSRSLSDAFFSSNSQPFSLCLKRASCPAGQSQTPFCVRMWYSRANWISYLLLLQCYQMSHEFFGYFGTFWCRP